MRSLILAVQFLTRLPTPQLRTFDPAWLAGAIRWFAVVGLLVGALVAALGWLGAWLDPWLAALLMLVTCVWVTGGLHLDGLGDLADGLGAAHRSPERFLAVLKDPHTGSFAVITLALQLLAKLVLLMLAVRHGVGWSALVLLPAWARLGAVWWTTLPPLSAGGHAERFAWRHDWPAFWLSWLLLAALSAWLAPVLLLAPVLWWGWRRFLWRRLGGMSGDCLGAGIELTETGLLLLAVLATRLPLA